MDRDKKLIRRIKKRSSRAAANELVSRYYREIYIYVYKQTCDRELSMDLTQDIFISTLQSIDSYDENKASFRTWLYKIATYRLVDYYRSKFYKYKDITVPIEGLEMCDREDIAVTVENRQAIYEVIDIVNKLDAAAQQIFRLKFFAEYTFSEIASTLEMPESTVKTKYYSMLRKIRKDYKEGSHG